MRSNIVSEAGLPTRLNQWWAGIPFITSSVTVICGIIYLVCLLVGYDSFIEICFLPSEVISKFQAYRIYTAVLFHGSILHIVFNMLALVPLGTELERIMGSIRLLYLMILLATTNAIFHLIIALIVAYNPLHPYPFLMHECAIGFSGVIFSMIVIETNLSGVQTKSVFGLLNVPAKWYAWILLVLFQLLATNVSLLGHLCGILSGFAYSCGLFNYLLPGSSFYGTIESSPLLSACVRRPGFILCSGGATYGMLPTQLNSSTTSSLVSENLWRNMASWMPRRGTTINETVEDSRFPGRARTLGSTRSQQTSGVDSHLSLQAGLLENSDTYNHLETSAIGTETRPSDARHLNILTERDTESATTLNQNLDSFEEKLKMLVGMGFEKTLAEVALAAADGDTHIAIEILMSQHA